MSEGLSEGLGAGAGDTGWRFLVEPAALVRAFLKHPPQGFPVALSASGTPLFAAPLDLLTTVEDGLRRRISAWPLYRIWGRWLRLRGCFAGSTVSEYLPLGAPAWRPRRRFANCWRPPLSGRNWHVMNCW